MKRDRKTTIIGLVMASSAFVLAYSADLHAHPIVIDVAKFLIGGGMAAFGFVAKDSE